MTTVEEATRLLTGEVEDCVAMLGNRLVGGGMRVESIRVALGQTGDVAEDESFLLAPGGEGRPGWAVEVRVLASEEVPAAQEPPPAGAAAMPLQSLAGQDCTVLRGTDADTATLLAEAGIRTVDELALLPEARLGDLLVPGAGMRLVDAWSRAQLLRIPLPAVKLGDLGGRMLSELVARTPAELRGLGLAAGTPDAAAEELARTLAFLGSALDLAVCRTLTLSQLAAGA